MPDDTRDTPLTAVDEARDEARDAKVPDAQVPIPEQIPTGGGNAAVERELLVVVGNKYADLKRELELEGGAEYKPGKPVDDVRVATFGKERADINARLKKAEVPVRLWRFERSVEGIQRDFAERGVHFNNTLLGARKISGPGGTGNPVPAAKGTLPDTPVDGDPSLVILDTGVPSLWETWFPELGNAVNLFSPFKTDDATGNPAVDRAIGHGMFVSGIVRQVEPTVRMTVRRVLRWRLADEAFLAAELASVTEPVVSLSIVSMCTLGAAGPVGVRAAIEKLLADGKVVVAAAGNGGVDGGVLTEFYPAMLKGVIAVGAMDSRTSPPTLPDFSNRGRFVDVWAPGIGVRSTFLKDVDLEFENGSSAHFDGWATWHGTSFAAPMVAARIARLVADDKSKRTPAQVAREFLDDLPDSDLPGGGKLFDPKVPGLVVPT